MKAQLKPKKHRVEVQPRYASELSTGKRVRVLEETLESIVVETPSGPSRYLPKKGFRLGGVDMAKVTVTPMGDIWEIRFTTTTQEIAELCEENKTQYLSHWPKEITETMVAQALREKGPEGVQQCLRYALLNLVIYEFDKSSEHEDENSDGYVEECEECNGCALCKNPDAHRSTCKHHEKTEQEIAAEKEAANKQ